MSQADVHLISNKVTY